MAEYFFGITDKGKRREKNEDTFIAREFCKKQLVAACVIDGVGGYSGGDVAAAIARAVIVEHLQNLREGVVKTLQSAIIAANDKILEEKKKDNKNEQMACVLTCAVTDIRNNKLYYAHVGDTRLYLLRDHSLVKLSKDHSVVGFLEESGRLSEEDAMRHPRRNEITKALGFEENIANINDFIETGESPFLAGDVALVCSDGLSDMISSNAISSILLKKNSLAERAAELVDAANDAGGTDNITAVLIQNNNQPAPRVALKPVERTQSTKKSQGDVSKNLGKEHREIPVRRNRSFIPLLTLACLGLLAMVWLQKNPPVKGNNVLKTVAVKPKDENLDLFNRSAGDSTKIYKPGAGVSFLNLAGPVLINKDSFYIKGHGVTLTCDSNFRGPAIVVSSAAKHVVLDSIVFKNFDVAIIVQKNNMALKNVRFINCRVPIQYQLSFGDTAISGRLKDSIFILLPTLKKH